MAPPQYKPTDKTRKIVQMHVAIGTKLETIAEILGVTDKTLKKYYAKEITTGLSAANESIASSLFQAAKGGNVTAMIFWLKTRGRWREAHREDVDPVDTKGKQGTLSENLDEETIKRLKRIGGDSGS